MATQDTEVMIHAVHWQAMDNDTPNIITCYHANATQLSQSWCKCYLNGPHVSDDRLYSYMITHAVKSHYNMVY